MAILVLMLTSGASGRDVVANLDPDVAPPIRVLPQRSCGQTTDDVSRPAAVA